MSVMGRADFTARYEQIGRELFALTDLDEADICVFPVEWKKIRDTPSRVAEARSFRAMTGSKPTVFFCATDDEKPVLVEDATVFRTSLLRSRQRPQEFALPGAHEDLLEYTDGALITQEKPEKPTVSFCGFVLYPERGRTPVARLKGRASELRRKADERLGRPSDRDVYARGRAIDALLRQRTLVLPDITIRHSGGGGGWTTKLRAASADWDVVRAEYVRTIVDSHYVLCARGIGNWSYRLYETLCLGRIPVLVDTDIGLPYDFAIPWRDHVVWIDRRDIPNIGERIAEFHAKLSAPEFEALQHANRKLWCEWLSPEGFFSNFYRHFPGLPERGNEAGDETRTHDLLHGKETL